MMQVCRCSCWAASLFQRQNRRAPNLRRPRRRLLEEAVDRRRPRVFHRNDLVVRTLGYGTIESHRASGWLGFVAKELDSQRGFSVFPRVSCILSRFYPKREHCTQSIDDGRLKIPYSHPIHTLFTPIS